MNGFVSSKAKLPKILLGIVSLIIGGVMLYYWSARPQPSVENYYETDIVYSAIVDKSQREYAKIVIRTKDKEYELHAFLWQGAKIEPELIVQELIKSKNAKIWLNERDGDFIRGIITPTLKIDPTIGVEYDSSDNNLMWWIAIIFIACGLILVVLVPLPGEI